MTGKMTMPCRRRRIYLWRRNLKSHSRWNALHPNLHSSARGGSGTAIRPSHRRTVGRKVKTANMALPTPHSGDLTFLSVRDGCHVRTLFIRDTWTEAAFKLMKVRAFDGYLAQLLKHTGAMGFGLQRVSGRWPPMVQAPLIVEQTLKSRAWASGARRNAWLDV